MTPPCMVPVFTLNELNEFPSDVTDAFISLWNEMAAFSKFSSRISKEQLGKNHMTVFFFSNFLSVRGSENMSIVPRPERKPYWESG